MNKFGINCLVRSKHFFIVIFNFLLVKAAMNVPHPCKLSKDCLTSISHGAIVLTKASTSSFSNCQRRNKDHCALANYGGGLSFRSLDKHIYDCKFRNDKKYLYLSAQWIFTADICIVCLIGIYKMRRRSNTLKGSQRMGGGQNLLKNLNAFLFHKNLSNETHFSLIHLAEQYL